MFLMSAVVMALSNFLFKAVGKVLVNDLAKNEAVSILTEGFLLFKASRTSSKIASKLVCQTNDFSFCIRFSLV